MGGFEKSALVIEVEPEGGAHNRWAGPIKAHRVRRRGRNLGLHIQPCNVRAWVWESDS